MSGVLKIEITESENELRELAKKEQDPIVKERIQTLYWLKTNQVESVNHLAVLTGRHRTTVSRWLSTYRREGLKALLEVGKSSGRPNAIAPQIQAKIKEELSDPEGFTSYGEIQKWLEAVHDLKVSYTVVYKLVRYQLKAKLKVPRPVNIKQEKEAREAFKKNLPNHLEKIKNESQETAKKFQKIRYWCQDESRLGLMTILDNGGFHRRLDLEIPQNIILLFQPPYCPELNPIERLWQDLKRPLRWQNFNDLEELRQKLREMLNSLTTEVIASVTGWQFILEALSVAGI